PSIAVDLLQRGIAALGPGSQARSELESHLATTMFHLGRYDEAERLSRHATAGVAIPDKRARLTWIRAYALPPLVAQDQALALIGNDPQAADLRVLLLSNRVYLTMHLDRPAEAEQVLVELLQAAEQFGAPVRLATSRMAAATQWFEYGRWDDAVAEMESLA